jgi:hypothetical protein
MSAVVVFLLTLALVAFGQPAAAITLDFEGLADGESVTTQFSGVTFGNTIALISGAAGGTLNEIDFPPHSGITVVFPDSGPITISFATPVASVSGFFTYAASLTLTALDASLAIVATDTSDFSENFGSSGTGVPNELLEVAFAGGISSVTIAGGDTLTLDDLTFVAAAQAAAPETPTYALLLVAAAVFIAVAGRPRRLCRVSLRPPIAR